MGYFTFKHRETGAEQVLVGSIEEAEAWERDHPELEWMCGSPLIHYGRGRHRADEGFRDVLREIKRKNHGSTIEVR